MTSMEPDSLRFLTLINKVQSHSDGVLAGLRCLCFQDTREGMVKFLVKVIRPESKKKIDFSKKIHNLIRAWYHVIEIFLSLYWDQASLGSRIPVNENCVTSVNRKISSYPAVTLSFG